MELLFCFIFAFSLGFAVKKTKRIYKDRPYPVYVDRIIYKTVNKIPQNIDTTVKKVVYLIHPDRTPSKKELEEAVKLLLPLRNN